MSTRRQQAPRRRVFRRGRGALAAIGGLLIASAAVRIGTGATEAIAAQTLEPPAVESSDLPPETCTGEADIAPMLAALDKREARIAERETDLRTRIQALSVAETEIDRKMAALEEAEANLRATLALANGAAEEDLARLTDVYANMKPKQAAALFEEMDPNFAAGFLGRMRPDAAAAILAGLTPRAAYTISVVLAGRNADVPKE